MENTSEDFFDNFYMVPTNCIYGNIIKMHLPNKMENFLLFKPVFDHYCFTEDFIALAELYFMDVTSFRDKFGKDSSNISRAFSDIITKNYPNIYKMKKYRQSMTIEKKIEYWQLLTEVFILVLSDWLIAHNYGADKNTQFYSYSPNLDTLSFRANKNPFKKEV